MRGYCLPLRRWRPYWFSKGREGKCYKSCLASWVATHSPELSIFRRRVVIIILRALAVPEQEDQRQEQQQE